MNIDRLEVLAQQYESELREYRLSGDLKWLLPIFTSALDQSIDINKMSQEFFSSLTNNENMAFQAIREEIGFSGNISIVKMIQKTNLSRPVFTSLLQKMEKFGIAQIKNQGVKGTNIIIREDIDNGNDNT